MTRAALALLLTAVVAVAADLPTNPQQARLFVGEKTFPVVYVFSETMEGVTFALDNPDSPQTQYNHGKYSRIEYAKPGDVPWLKGDNLEAKGDLAEAAAQFSIAATTGSTWYSRHSGFLRAAECFLAVGKPDDAIKSIDAMLAVFPKSVEQARIAFIRGQALAKKGDSAGAIKVYAELSKHTADWGIDAAALGALGQAALLAADKKNAESAAVLQPIFAKLDPVKDARFAQVGIELARQQGLAGQAAPALATLRRLAYGSPEANDRAQAHIDWAKQLMAANDAAALFLAFDHAAIARNMRQIEAATGTAAQGLIAQVVGKIDRLPADQCSSELKAEYRRYLSR